MRRLVVLVLVFAATARLDAADGPPARVWAARLDTGSWVASPGPDGPALPPGSLLKVVLFLTAADAEPASLGLVAACGPSSPRERSGDTCWDRRGHGTVGFRRGLAFSCQRFARLLASRISEGALADRFGRLGLKLPQGLSSRSAATGHDSSFRCEPSRLLAILMACVNGGYLFDLSARPPRLARRLAWRAAAVREVVEGMRLCALEGTARAAATRGALAKTGTTEQLDSAGRPRPAHTQGWAFLCVPQAREPIAVLVHLPAGTGAQAAAEAGRALARLTNR